MRYLLLASAAALLPQASAAETGPALAPAVEAPWNTRETNCRNPTSYKAESDLVWRDQPLVPRKLDQLPPGRAYMAVYRTINGCEVPMTVVEYRTGRR